MLCATGGIDTGEFTSKLNGRESLYLAGSTWTEMNLGVTQTGNEGPFGTKDRKLKFSARIGKSVAIVT